MTTDINYEEVTVPDDKHPSEYSYVERRGEIYTLMKEAGHPKNLNQTRLAERYDVSTSQVHKDFKKLKSFRRENVGSDAVSTTEFVLEKSIREMLERGEYEKASKLQLDYMDWLYDEGVRTKAADEVDHRHAHKHDHDHDKARELTDEQLKHIDAMTGGSGEIEVEAVEKGELDN